MASPHQYGYGSRLSSAYTAGVDGKPYPQHNGPKSSAAYKAWLSGNNQYKLSQFYAASDAQAAADLLGKIRDSIELQNAMDAATQIGFRVEFYANSIRVSL